MLTMIYSITSWELSSESLVKSLLEKLHQNKQLLPETKTERETDHPYSWRRGSHSQTDSDVGSLSRNGTLRK